MLVEPGTTGYTLFKFVGTAVIYPDESVRWKNGSKFVPQAHMVLKFLATDVFEVYEKTEELIMVEKSGKFKSHFENERRAEESNIVIKTGLQHIESGEFVELERRKLSS